MYRYYLSRYLRPQARKAGLLAVFFTLAIALDLSLPQVLAAFIDRALNREPLPLLMQLALIYLGVSILGQLLTVAETYLATDIGMVATNRLRADLTRHCLHLDLHFHNARTPGELIERVDGDVGVLNQFFARFLVRVMGNVVLLVGVLVMLYRIDWRVSAAIGLFTAITLLILSRLSDIGIPYWTADKEARAQYFGFIEERLTGTEDIRANGAVPYVMRGLLQLARIAFRKNLVSDLVGSIAWSSVLLVYAIGSALALGLAAWLFVAGEITLGTAYLIFGYTQLLNRPIGEIVREIDQLQEAGASLGRVHELIQTRPRLENGSRPLPQGPPGIFFKNVRFDYRAGEDPGDRKAIVTPLPQAPFSSAAGAADSLPRPVTVVLDELSFELAPGQILGLLGRTGSGKTTIARLLVRLYDPQAGRISLGANAAVARQLADFDLNGLRSGIGMVTQEVQLFNASLRENLTFFDPSVSDQRIRRALKRLQLWDWVASFPQGLDTRLQADGAGLSAGEAQLLAFARVFLKDPGLIILDEASSRLDPATERRLEGALDHLLDQRTAIIIAHRLSTVERADQILILDQGRILEHGDRHQLMSDPSSRFAQLLQTGLQAELA